MEKFVQSVKRPRLEDDADKLETLSTNTNDNENTNIAVGPNDLSANPSEGPTRSFSALKIIKTYLRSTSGNERTSNIAVLSINEERTKQLNVDTIINAFAANHNNRRIVLL